MINVVVSGCNGAMGRVLTKAIEEMEDITIVAGIDKNINSYKNTYPDSGNTGPPVRFYHSSIPLPPSALP